MMFRVNIPGVGNIFVEAKDQNEAIAAAQKYVGQNGIQLEQGAGNFTAVEFSSGSLPTGSTVIGADGRPVSGNTGGGAATGGGNPLIPGVGDTLPPSGNPGSPLAPVTPAVTQPGPSNLYEAVPADTQVERELAAPDAAFRAFLKQRGAPTGGVLGNILQSTGSVAPRLFALQGAAQAGQGAAGLQESTLMDFFNQNIPGQGVTRGLGRNALQNLRSLSGVGAGNAVTDPFLRPDSFGSEGAQDVRSAGRAALTGRNAFLGSRFGSQIDDALQSRFQDSVFQGQQSPNFAQWVLNNLGF